MSDENAIGAIVADGWYAGYVGYGVLVGYGPNRSGRCFYGKTPAFMAQLMIEYEDGRRKTIVTDTSWTVTGDGPVREADIQGGETYDVRVRLVEGRRQYANDVLDVPVRSRSGKFVPLRNLVDVEESTGPVQIDRQDRSRQVTVMANLRDELPLGEALERVREIETALDLGGQPGLPPGVASAFTGAGS